MITKEEALRASKMSLAEMEQEYPKMGMLLRYIQKHYPNDMEKLCSNKMVQALMFNTDYSNDDIESMIDKVAIFNGYTKWSPNNKTES